jgi:hypothetical protein
MSYAVRRCIVQPHLSLTPALARRLRAARYVGRSVNVSAMEGASRTGLTSTGDRTPQSEPDKALTPIILYGKRASTTPEGPLSVFGCANAELLALAAFAESDQC